MIVGIEVGGTFTDLVQVDEGGGLTVHKVPSTPADPSIAAVTGMREILAMAGRAAADVTELLHGSTIAANALIQRRGARMALITTLGFRDVLFIQRQDKLSVYDMFYRKPEPLIGRDAAFEIEERLDAKGNVITPLSDAAITRLVDRIANDFGAQSIAVCLLHAYANPAHERRIAEAIAARHPDIRVSLSSAASPEHREYERTSTTVIDAYIGPAVDRYLTRFGERVAELGYPGTPLIMQSNGGAVPLEAARRRIVNMFVSGPAAAVTAAAEIANATDTPNVISLDVGGTSCDVCLIAGGQPETTVKGSAEFSVDGLPLNVIMTDIVTIGAGGGSIAHLDAGGMLKVGPQSAGADPGPACYGHGGDAFTLTDAMLLLGLLDPAKTLPGDIALRPDLAAQAAAALCASLDLAPVALAARVYRIVIANMAQALRRVSVNRGHDPRDFTLLPCGGAGPLVAATLADEIGMDKILIPPHPGIFSAYGLAVADVRIDYVRADGAIRTDRLTRPALQARVDELRGQAITEFEALGYDTDGLDMRYFVDARYVGQGFKLRVQFDPAELARDGVAGLDDLFHDLHAKQYNHSFPGKRVEAISFRLTASHPRPALPPRIATTIAGEAVGTRAVTLGGPAESYDIYQRAELPPGFAIDGPVIVVEATTSTPVPPDWRLTVQDNGAIMLTRSKT